MMRNTDFCLRAVIAGASRAAQLAQNLQAQPGHGARHADRGTSFD